MSDDDLAPYLRNPERWERLNEALAYLLAGSFTWMTPEQCLDVAETITNAYVSGFFQTHAGGES